MKLESFLSGNINKFFNLETSKLFILWNVNKKCFNLGAGKLHFLKYQTFFRGDFFYFASLDLSARKVALYITIVRHALKTLQH